jgi:hypothetical protein
MSKTVCIYPQDATTDFLRPLCDHIFATFDAVEVGYDTSGDDDPMEIIFDEIKDAETIFFLGHGMSTCLYASILDNVELFNKENITLLEGKRLFLLACNSDQFITKFKLADAVGFGFLPTSEEDIERTKQYHKLDISMTGILDVECFKTALVQCLINTLSRETMDDPYLFREKMLFNTCSEIVDCLTNKISTNYRIVADELYYMYKDMIVM